ncbi:hypothetical protein IM41_03705 [Fervidobacterium sp. SC_NGM5_G05]|nr:hypothetical protein IM41_03705 [Fervidobacterium sp. SC_NGM5_G05]
MFTYFFIFSVLLFLTLLHYEFDFDKNSEKLIKTVIFVFLLLFIGLRHEVGGDWDTYLWWYKDIAVNGIDFSFNSIWLSDFGYNFINWFSSKLGFGIYGVNTFCGFIFLLGLFKFLEYLENDRSFYLGLLISYPYLIMVVANGYTRQSVALGFILLSLVNLNNNGKLWKSLLLQIFAMFFHKTSVIGLFLFFFYIKKSKYLLYLILLAISIFVSLLPLFSRLYTFYIENLMFSEGGILRGIMNLIPATIYIIFYKKFEEQHFEERYKDSKLWLWISIFVFILSSISLLKFTFADRLALYFSIIQVVSFTRLEKLLREIEFKGLLFIILIFVYLLSLIIWLMFAVHAKEWIPYKNIILIKLGFLES